jgi:hypothetical protein
MGRHFIPPHHGEGNREAVEGLLGRGTPPAVPVPTDPSTTLRAVPLPKVRRYL